MVIMVVSEKIKKKIKRKLKEEGVKSIAIFGSYTRGEEEPESDLDILVEFSEPKSLFDIARIERNLSGIIGKKVDLVTGKSLSPYLKEQVEREKEVLI